MTESRWSRISRPRTGVRRPRGRRRTRRRPAGAGRTRRRRPAHRAARPRSRERPRGRGGPAEPRREATATEPPAGANARTSAWGNRARSRSIGWAGRAVSVRVTWSQRSSTSASAASVSNVSRSPLTRASRRGTGASTNSAALDTVAAEVDQPAPLGVVGLGEGVGQRRPAVAQGVAEHRPAVEVAERGVGDAVEERRRHHRHAPDADVTLRLARQAAGHEGVGQHHRAHRPRGQVGAHAAHGLGDGRLVAASRQPPRLVERLRVEVGETVHRDRAVLVGQEDRRTDPGGVGAQEDAGRVDQPRAEAEALGRVVVAGRQHHLGARGGQPGERLVSQAYGVDVGQGAVVDVARDDDEVHLLRLDHPDQVVDEGRLVLEHAHAVERATEVPVGGVEDPHETNLGTSTDTIAPPRRSPAESAQTDAQITPSRRKQARKSRRVGSCRLDVQA